MSNILSRAELAERDALTAKPMMTQYKCEICTCGCSKGTGRHELTNETMWSLAQGHALLHPVKVTYADGRTEII